MMKTLKRTLTVWAAVGLLLGATTMAAVALVRSDDSTSPTCPVIGSAAVYDPAVSQLADEVHALTAQSNLYSEATLHALNVIADRARTALPAYCPQEDEALFWTGDYPDAGGWECRVVDDVCAERLTERLDGTMPMR